MTKTKLYWAYGSNLDPDQMQKRCPGAEQVARLVVPESRLVFRIVADVESAGEDDMIHGGLWRITDEHEEELDRCEGAHLADGRYVKAVVKARVKGKIEKCLYYRMRSQKGIMRPTRQYYRTIERGYRAFGYDPALLEKALEHTCANEKPTGELMQRHQERGWPALVARPAKKILRQYNNDNEACYVH